MKLRFGFVLVLLFWWIAGFGSPSPAVELEDVYLGWKVWIDDSFNIYTNINQHQIAKYSPKGEQLLVIGRKGEGPGDIKRFGGMAVNPKDNLLYVTEFFRGNKRISVFSPTDGHFVKIWPCQLDYKKWPGVSMIQFDSHGNVYLQVGQFNWRRRPNFDIGFYKRMLVKFDPTGNKIKELYRLEADSSAYRDKKGHPNIPYQNNLEWIIHQDKLYIRQSRHKYISVFKLDGTPIKKIPLPFDRSPVTQQDIDAWAKWQLSFPSVRQRVALGRFDIKFWKKNLPFPEYKSISTGPMFIGPNNAFYSQKVSKTYNGNDNTFAVISLDTGATNIRQFPPHYTIRAIKNDTFYFRVRTEDDEEILKILTLQELQKQYEEKDRLQ